MFDQVWLVSDLCRWIGTIPPQKTTLHWHQWEVSGENITIEGSFSLLLFFLLLYLSIYFLKKKTNPNCSARSSLQPIYNYFHWTTIQSMSWSKRAFDWELLQSLQTANGKIWLQLSIGKRKRDIKGETSDTWSTNSRTALT